MTAILESDWPALEPETESSPSAVCLTTLDALSEWADRWRQLSQQAGGPIEQYEWAAACAPFERQVGRLHVVALQQADRLLAVAPLALQRVHGVLRRTMLGVDWHHEPMDLLAHDEEALRHLAAELARCRMPHIFGRLPADSPAVQALHDAFARRALVLIRQQAAYPYIALDESWIEPEKHLNAGRRSDLRRAWRRAEKLGRVEVQICAPRLDELDALLDECYLVEAHSWKGQNGTALVCDPPSAQFCRDYAREACQQGILRLCLLRIGGQAAAMQIALAHRGFWLLKIGYDAQFASCSPGMLLLRESIAYAAREGHASFEFLGEAEPWIEVWTSAKRPCVAVRTYPYNFGGAAALATDVAVKLGADLRSQASKAAVRARGVAKACAMPLMKRVARNYIAGDLLSDARRVCDGLAQQGQLATIGFWDTARDSARAVADQYIAGLEALADQPQGSYLSIKLPALRFSDELFGEVVQRGCTLGRRVHCDSHGPETADRTRQMIEAAQLSCPNVDLGLSIPGRWRRSVEDARWACQRSLFVRVVKGEWVDPDDPQRDMRRGFLEVIDELAGKARHVGVASHDVPLAAEAIRRLRAAGTPCDLELLYGLPMRASLRMAQSLGVTVRVYVPYGEAYMPYALGQVRRKPYILWWLARDLVASWF